MFSFEMEVKSMRYPTDTMSRLLEQGLKYTHPDEDWYVKVEQKDDCTLEISLMSVN